MEILKNFANRFNRNDAIKKASQSDIVSLELEFNIRLPKDYKVLIKQYGNIYTPSILDIIVDNEIEINDVQEFWDIETIIFDKKNEWTSKIKPDLLPFASNCMGSIFGFLTSDLKNERESSAVYFFDHDFDTVEKIKDSFTGWINDFNKL